EATRRLPSRCSRPFAKGASDRVGSPPGGSTLITSIPKSRKSLPQNAPIDEVKSRTRNPGRSEVDVLVSAICLTEDRRWRMEDGKRDTLSSILHPRFDLLLALVVLNNMLRQPPAQNFRRAFGDADAPDLPVPPFQRQFSHQS